eukprot:1146314-Pelagomonas_calceolata.AAC.1
MAPYVLVALITSTSTPILFPVPGSAAGDVLWRQVELHYNCVICAGATHNVYHHPDPLLRGCATRHCKGRTKLRQDTLVCRSELFHDLNEALLNTLAPTC